MRQSACLVFNTIMVDNYAPFFNCTHVRRASDYDGPDLRTSKIQNLLLFVTNIINQSEILFLISRNLFLILISMLILLSLEIVKIQNLFINQPDI